MGKTCNGRKENSKKKPERRDCEPQDIDTVILLPPDFQLQIEQGIEAAIELEDMMSRCPEEIFAAEDETDWNEWIEFFGRTREADGRRKGLVEVKL